MLLPRRFDTTALGLSFHVQLCLAGFLRGLLDRSSPLGCAFLLAAADTLLGNLWLRLPRLASCLCHRCLASLLKVSEKLLCFRI